MLSPSLVCHSCALLHNPGNLCDPDPSCFLKGDLKASRDQLEREARDAFSLRQQLAVTQKEASAGVEDVYR